MKLLTRVTSAWGMYRDMLEKTTAFTEHYNITKMPTYNFLKRLHGSIHSSSLKDQ